MLSSVLPASLVCIVVVVCAVMAVIDNSKWRRDTKRRSDTHSVWLWFSCLNAAFFCLVSSSTYRITMISWTVLHMYVYNFFYYHCVSLCWKLRPLSRIETAAVMQ